MANAYTQIYIHLIFAVKNRGGLIHDAWKDELYKYITGIIDRSKSKLLIINGMNDHIHIFLGYKPSISLSDLVKNIKVASSTWVNEKKFLNVKFAWQEGYGAFSYSQSHKDLVYNYILNQQAHHKRITFKEEY